jgi:hypothetical protein
LLRRNSFLDLFPFFYDPACALCSV